MSNHMRPLMTRLRGSRGGRSITSGSAGSTPSASAGPESVRRLIQRIWVARSGTTTADPSSGTRPITPASTTPRNMTSTSPTFDESR